MKAKPTGPMPEALLNPLNAVVAEIALKSSQEHFFATARFEGESAVVSGISAATRSGDVVRG